MRQRLAQEAARIMAEEGVGDFHTAKRKAAARLGANDTRNLPRNTEIEQELRSYQRLFLADSQPQRLDRLRRVALQAMGFLAHFQPRLVGSVLEGTAGVHSDVNLQLFADSPEEVNLFLMEQQIPFEHAERRLRFGEGEGEAFPAFRLLADQVAVELVVLPPKLLRQAPLSPVDGRPMQRASRAAVEALLAADGAASGV